MKVLQIFGDEDIAVGEPASSKDSLTRLQSPRTSKSGGTVIQQVKENSKGRRDSQSEECTSSASDQFQEPPMHTVGRAVLHTTNTTVHAVALSKSGTSSKSLDKPPKPSSSERSQNSHSMANRTSTAEEAQSKRERKMAEKRLIAHESEAELCSPPPIPADSLAKPPLPPADSNIQKVMHRSGKRREMDLHKGNNGERVACYALHARSGSSSPDVVSNSSKNDELSVPQEGAEEGPDLFRVSSNAGAQPSHAVPEEAFPETDTIRPETDAMAPPDIPQFQKRQRSKLGKRPSPAQSIAPPDLLTTGRKSAKRQHSKQPPWSSDSPDDDYVPPGPSVDVDSGEVKTPRLSRARTLVAAQEDLYALQRRPSVISARGSDLLATHNSLARSTRSQPVDFSPLWKDFFPAVTPAKRMRGFNLSAAVNKLQEFSEEDQASCERTPFSLVRKPRVSCGGEEVSECLRQEVQQSVSGIQASRQSFGSYLSGTAPTVPCDRLPLASRFIGSIIGKALQASESQEGPLKPRNDDDIRLPLDYLTDSNLETNLDAWEQELNAGDVSQSSVRKRQQSDVQHVWEDFYESENLEKSVLSDLQEWLEPKDELECPP